MTDGLAETRAADKLGWAFAPRSRPGETVLRRTAAHVPGLAQRLGEPARSYHAAWDSLLHALAHAQTARVQRYGLTDIVGRQASGYVQARTGQIFWQTELDSHTLRRIACAIALATEAYEPIDPELRATVHAGPSASRQELREARAQYENILLQREQVSGPLAVVGRALERSPLLAAQGAAKRMIALWDRLERTAVTQAGSRIVRQRRYRRAVALRREQFESLEATATRHVLAAAGVSDDPAMTVARPPAAVVQDRMRGLGEPGGLPPDGQAA